MSVPHNVTRREVLRTAGMGALGGSATGLVERAAAAAESMHGPRFGQAKACILVFLYGSPPQHETFDPKPMAPVEIQGEMGAIATNVAGLEICDRLPRHASIMDKVTVVRSMSHPYPEHGVGYVTSAMPMTGAELNSLPRDSRQRPYIGSIVDYLEQQRTGNAVPEIPYNIGLPWLLGVKSDKYGSGTKRLSGPYASFLGPAYDPLWTDFDGKGTRTVPKLDANAPGAEVFDPFAGVTPEGRFNLGASCVLPNCLTEQRFQARKTLLSQIDPPRARLDNLASVKLYEQHQQLAYALMSNGKLAEALAVQRESPEVRARYGMTLFGQSLLAARRLVEAGGKFISVFWDPYGPFGGCCWDTHANHFPRLKEYLLPVFDESFPSFLQDMDERGLLQETAVLCISEHGRTPKIDSGPKGAARHHWSRAYSAVYAGGGFARGRVVGKTDALGGDVAHTPISPKDVLATTYHLLGIDPETTIPDETNRPNPISGEGTVRFDLID